MVSVEEDLTRLLNVLREVKPSYKYSYDRVGELDMLTVDYLHKLELVDLEYTERNKLATQLRKVRKERRYHKDQVEQLYPLVEFINKNMRQVKELERVLGEIRSIEERQSNRMYTPRCMSENEYYNDK